MKKEIVLMGATLISLFFLHLSCKKIDNSTSVIENEYKFVFPDTVIVNKKYNGKIIYEGLMDSLTTKMGRDKSVNRFILYSYTKSKYPFRDITEISKSTDTIMALESSSIDLLNISFSKTGVNYISGIINDNVILNEVDKNGMAKVIVNNLLANHKVIVIEN